MRTAALVVSLFAVVSSGAEAVVLCRRNTGALMVRESACRKRETPVDPTTVLPQPPTTDMPAMYVTPPINEDYFNSNTRIQELSVPAGTYFISVTLDAGHWMRCTLAASAASGFVTSGDSDPNRRTLMTLSGWATFTTPDTLALSCRDLNDGPTVLVTTEGITALAAERMN